MEAYNGYKRNRGILSHYLGCQYCQYSGFARVMGLYSKSVAQLCWLSFEATALTYQIR